MEKYKVCEKNELMHYGILGMHWGIRRYQPYSTTGPRKGGKTGKEIGEAAKARARYVKEKAREYKLKRREKNIERYNKREAKRQEDNDYKRKIGKKPKNFQDWTNEELADYIKKENLMADARAAKNKRARVVRETVDRPRSALETLSGYINTGSKFLDNIDSLEKSYKKIKKLLDGEIPLSDMYQKEVTDLLRDIIDKDGHLSTKDWHNLDIANDNLNRLLRLEKKGAGGRPSRYDDDDYDDYDDDDIEVDGDRRRKKKKKKK